MLPLERTADCSAATRASCARAAFSADRAQCAAVARLEAAARAADRCAERRPCCSGCVAGAQPRPAARGLYLWGPVGRGKTWLMDLFFDSLPLAANAAQPLPSPHARRACAAAPAARQRDPLAAVARQLAADLRVLCLDELFVSDIADAMILGELFTALLARGIDTRHHLQYGPGGALPRRTAAQPLPAGDRAAGARAGQWSRWTAASTIDCASCSTQPHLLRQPRAGNARAAAAVVAGARRRPRRSAAACSCRAASCAPVARSGRCHLVRASRHCARVPRSQNDYVELAEEFHTVLLSDVPVFDSPSRTMPRAGSSRWSMSSTIRASS